MSAERRERPVDWARFVVSLLVILFLAFLVYFWIDISRNLGKFDREDTPAGAGWKTGFSPGNVGR
jgi:hypothetical protein